MAEKDTGWKDIFTLTTDGLTIVASKAFINYKAEYTVRFGVVKKDKDGSYFSPNIPAEQVNTEVMRNLYVTAGTVITKDLEKDVQAEADRVRALAAKPGTAINVRPAVSAGPMTPRDKGAPRATGKTAKKKAKLAARAEEARAAASK